MLWIALRPPAPFDASSKAHEPPPPPEQQALAWWALGFSPRVCVLEEAVLLEVQGSLRLFGGQRALLQRLRAEAAEQGARALAVAPTALAALALLRTLRENPQPASSSPTSSTSNSTTSVSNLATPASDSATPVRAELVEAPAESDPEPIPAKACTPAALQRTLDALPLTLLSATHTHAPTLQRLGCRTLGQLRALPRGGVSRRFGAALLEALDRVYGARPEAFDWIELPEQFSVRLECNGRIEVAEGMLFGARRLLGQLASWLQARQRGVVAITLHWEHDLVRRGELHHGQLLVRTAEATRDITHLARLLGEHLARLTLPAPVQAIRLDATETEALETASASLLPEDVRQGEPLQQLIERLSVRLGAHRVLRGQTLADHRPQHMQAWRPADEPVARARAPALPRHLQLHPPWILRAPLRLAVQGERPIYQGPLLMLAGPERLESGWWSLASSAEVEGEELALRDYFVARSLHAGLLWVYRRRSAGEPAWFLQGVYG